MPTTYSTNLRLALMATGENSGTWGTITNTNLGTLLEQAISGVATVSMSDTNKTLTALDGSIDESRNMVITLTGTLSATRNVIIPSVDKMYLIRNSTSGGQSVLVKTASGSGATVPNACTVALYCDGTNVFQASPAYNATTSSVIVPGDLLVTGTISGTLAVSSVPTSTILEYGGTSAPTGYLMCDGAAVSRSTYAALFAVIGTTYGAGNGSTTFNVPDRRDRVGIGAGSTYARGQTGGAATGTTSLDGLHSHTGVTGSTVLTTLQIPSHTHSGNTNTDGAHSHTTSSGAPNFVTEGTGTTANVSAGGGGYVLNTITSSGSHSHSFTTNSAGGGQGHTHTIGTDGSDHSHTYSTLQPYLASNYIIKT